MTRPFVNLLSLNRIDELMNEIRQKLDMFLQFGEVVGIMWKL